MADRKHEKGKDFQPDLFVTDNDNPDFSSQRESAVMYCDGASKGNPGRAGIGVVIYYDDDGHGGGGQEPHRISEYIGIATNNVAEYSALIRGLKEAGVLGIKKIRIFLDSELLVRQIHGIYKVKNKNLLPLWIQATNLLKDFDEYEVTHVRRELNSEADSLANQGVNNAV